MKPKDISKHLILSSSPHAHSKSSIRCIMLDVIIALIPTTLAGVWYFGLPAVYLILTCIATSVMSEAVCRRVMGREQTIGDFSAVLTGLLLALNLPAGLPLWMAAVGSAFAIIICKQIYGGLGMNPFNPALAARAFMLISFTGPMTTFIQPIAGAVFSMPDAATTPTPLAAIKPMFFLGSTHPTPIVGQGGIPSLSDLMMGNIPGCIGEVSSIALLLGAAYLLVRKVITWHIPVSFILAVWVYSLFAGGAPAHVQILTGGVVIGAFFMATDYVTSPITSRGKLIFGACAGLLVMLIRQFGSYPEGTSFAILIMNSVTPLINRWTQPKPFGAK
jgi:electron transport complex protein RnfD